MLKIVLLLTPIYVTLFWAITLNTDARKLTIPRVFLGKFMMFAVVVYVSHFLYFMPLPKVYPYIDALYQYASLMVFPMYYIYFRLLTIDSKFSFKLHARYLLIPTILFVFYSVAVVITPCNEYQIWLFDRAFDSGSFGIRFLNILKVFIRFTFMIQVVATVIGNYFLIKKHGDKAAQYYSDLEDSSTMKVRILNLSMIITGTASLILGALGRNFFTHEITGIAIASVVFSSMLFIIGWLGDKQKVLNPSFDANETLHDLPNEDELNLGGHKKLLEKLLFLFNDRKVYLNPRLNIQDVAQEVGTNRTYISSLINQYFNQNFCSFVNAYRVEELENILREHPDYTNQLLAESCGFGSVDSLRRAVFAKTELTLPQWKSQVVREATKHNKSSEKTV